MSKKKKAASPREESATFPKTISGCHSTDGFNKSKVKRKPLLCGVRHLAALRRELAGQGLALRNTRGVTQLHTLVQVLEYLGQRGVNTLEGNGLGFYRIATRVSELEEAGYVVASRREAVVGPDGLYHVGIARYILLGRREDGASPQLAFDLDAA